MAVGDLSSSPSSSSPELHVLAVDDSFVDRKVIERLLRISACKDNKIVSQLGFSCSSVLGFLI